MRLRSVSRSSPALSRHMRATAPALRAAVTTTDSKAIENADPNKFFDGESLVEHQARTRVADPNNRTFNYALLGGARFMGASTGRALVVNALASLNPAADVLALASIEVDIGNLQPGNCMTVKWRGKPIFIRSRTEDEIASVADTPMGELRDPEADEDRCQKPETFVMLGVCTHLGCVPINGAGDYNGWFCPCHGSHYDCSGRIRKGPAPANMEIPPYEFTEDTKLMIG